MQQSEILGLRWGQVDFDAGRLSVCRSVVSIGYEVHESPGKTRSSRRTVDLDPNTIEMLVRWQHYQQNETGGHDQEGPVFTKPDGTVMHPHSLSQAFERAVAKTTLPRISLHDLRHTHASLLLKAGVPLKVVSERLGHSSPAFTMATYQHILPGMQAEAVNLPGFLGGSDLWEDGAMTRRQQGKYPNEVRRRTVRLVLEHRDEYASEWAAITSIAAKSGMTAETLRKWVRQAEVDEGRRPGVTSEESVRVRELQRENRELRRANEILKAASAFFAAELDRPQQR